MSLNDLFVQILESEQKARERKNLLSEIKGKIGLAHQQLHVTEEEVNSLQAEVASKLNELSAQDLECRWIGTKESILCNQLAEQSRQKMNYNERMFTEQSSRNRLNEQFQADVCTFMSQHCLAGKGEEQRLAATGENLEQYKIKEDHLTAEVEFINQQKELVFASQQEKITLEKEIDLLKDKSNELCDKIERENLKTKKLEEKKKQIAERPHCDREFKRLQSELDACQDDSLEGLCQALQQQVDQLQRQQWQEQDNYRQVHKPHNQTASQDGCSSALPTGREAVTAPANTRPNLAKLRNALNNKTAI